MSSPDSKFLRLLTVLEEFAGQESMLLCAGDITAIRELQARAEPVLAELTRGQHGPLAPTVQGRLAALLTRRRGNQQLLDEKFAEVQAELERTRDNLQTIGRIAPVYGRHTRADRAGHTGTTHAVA